MTPLDRAHAAMQAAPEDDLLRLAFYDRLAEAELTLWLAAEPEGREIAPKIFELDSGPVALAFDAPGRLAAFAGEAVPVAVLSGRTLAAMLAGQGIGLGLNLEVAPSSILLPAEAIDWLAATLASAPDPVAEMPAEIGPPADLPDRLLAALEAKLATAQGLASAGVLARVSYPGGAAGHLLAFLDAAPGAAPALAQAVGEAVIFSGLEAGTLDVMVLEPGDPAAERLRRAGLRIEIPAPPPPRAPAPPGSQGPPRLR